MSRNFSKCQSLPQIGVTSQRAAFRNNKATMGGIILALTAGSTISSGSSIHQPGLVSKYLNSR